MIVIDTTVLVYAVGEDHPLREPCRLVLSLTAEGAIDATTTVEVIQEFVQVRARRRTRTDAAGLGRDLSVLLSPLLRPGEDDLRAGLDLFGSRPRIGAFDAVLAASAQAAGAAALVSADRTLRAAQSDRLRVLDPAMNSFEQALRSPAS